MQVIARKPQPRLLQSAVINPESETGPDRTVKVFGLSRLGRIALICGILFTLTLGTAAVIYWLESRRYPVVVTIGVPDQGESRDPLPHRPGRLVPVRPEMLHVSSIALGNPRLSIVNGKRLAEGEWLVLSTALGDASVRVIQIEDGFVRFRHGGETISAKLQATQKPKQ